jgi:hypothetical protein
MKKKTIGLTLAFAAGIILALVGLEVSYATGLMPGSLNTGKNAEVATSSNDNIGTMPANCKIIGLIPEVECYDYLTGGTSFSTATE